MPIFLDKKVHVQGLPDHQLLTLISAETTGGCEPKADKCGQGGSKMQYLCGHHK